MNIEELQDAIGRWERNEPADGDTEVIVDAARLVANPDIQAVIPVLEWYLTGYDPAIEALKELIDAAPTGDTQ